MKYTARDIKEWEVSTSNRVCGWVPARPINYTVDSYLSRVKYAWGVLTGRYDALDWEENTDVQLESRSKYSYGFARAALVITLANFLIQSLTEAISIRKAGFEWVFPASATLLALAILYTLVLNILNARIDAKNWKSEIARLKQTEEANMATPQNN